MTRMKVLVALVLGVSLASCGADSAEGVVVPDDPSGSGSVNVAQGGAQDFAEFRAIVEAGGVPAPETLDAVGFFAEHAVDLPAADCGQPICIHPMLSVMPRFDGSNWTMAFVAMNTPIDPATLERPPVHIVVAIDRTEWGALGVPLKAGVVQLAGALRPEDRISIVAVGTVAAAVLTAAAPTSLPEIDAAVVTATTGGQGVGLYDGLATAERVLREVPGFDGAQRILLVTNGRTNAGITDPEHIVALGEGIARDGISIGVVGGGPGYDARIPAALGSLGAGTYAYATHADIADVLRLEGETALFPLATDFQMRITPAPGYSVGRIYGVKRATAEPGLATLDLPALFIGHREGSKDVAGGRRGGGGGLFIELWAGGASAAGIGPDAPAFSMDASFTDAAGSPAVASRVVVNGLAPGQNPAGLWPFFSDPERGKPFMMLNMYLALKASVDFYASGDCAHAIGVIDMMGVSIDGWQGKYADPDISADNSLMLKLRSNLVGHCGAVEPIKPVSSGSGFEGGCAMAI